MSLCWAIGIFATCYNRIKLTTTNSALTCHWARTRPLRGRFDQSVACSRCRSWMACIISTFEFWFPTRTEVTGKRLLRLQCHFGLDTLRLARRGAIVACLDYLPKAIARVRQLARDTSLDARFVEGDVHAA